MLQHARAPIGQGSSTMTHVSVGKNRLSHKKINGMTTVYMEPNSEFELELRNTKDFVTLAKIKLNGKWISSSGLVLRPGESFYLDRYLDKNAKFRFSTYDVDDLPETKTAIRNNGKIEVFWYREAEPTPPSPITWIYTYGNSGTGQAPPNNDWWTSNVSSTTSRSVNASYTSGLDTDIIASCAAGAASFSTDSAKSIETGRVEEGSASQQRFRTVDMQFEHHYFSHDILKILPVSQAPVQSIRSYCDCGRRIRNKENFCPQCGRRN